MSRLTDDEINFLWEQSDWYGDFARALEIELLEKLRANKFVFYDPETGETWTPGAINDGCVDDEGLIALYTIK